MNQDILKLIDSDTWIASDHHHNHKRIGEFEPSRIVRATELGYESYEQMLIANHNQLVKPDDIVLFLGDFSFSSPQPAKNYNGRKIIIIGNHDTRGDHAYYDAGFEFVVRGTYVEQGEYLFHCPHPDPKQSMFCKVINDVGIAFTHYPLGFDDGYNRQHEDGSFSIMDRMLYSFQLANSIEIETIIHGHLHSKLASGSDLDYINVSLEHTDFTPVKIGDLL